MVINKSRSNSYSKSKEYKYDQKKIMKALVVKDIKRYFSSTVYVFNTFFGLVLMIIATIGLCTNFEKTIEYILSGEIPGLDINWLYSMAPKVFFLIVLVLSFMTSITSSSISIEGKTFNIVYDIGSKDLKVIGKEVEEYTNYDKQRLTVMPGCTGLWQVTKRNEADFDEMVWLDIVYINHSGAWEDLKLMIKTVLVMIHPNGAY